MPRIAKSYTLVPAEVPRRRCRSISVHAEAVKVVSRAGRVYPQRV